MNLSSAPTDKDLFGRIATGDEAAFREIFNRFTPQLYPFALDIVKNEAIAREIIQEVFLRVWLKRETLAEIEKPSSWLYRVASNISLTHFRRKRIEIKVLEAVYHSQPGQEENSEASLSAKELQLLIHQATGSLPVQRRRIFQLSREQGLSRKEIAERLGISENTVKNQLGVALKFIQDHIQKAIGIYIPAILIIPVLSNY